MRNKQFLAIILHLITWVDFNFHFETLEEIRGYCCTFWRSPICKKKSFLIVFDVWEAEKAAQVKKWLKQACKKSMMWSRRRIDDVQSNVKSTSQILHDIFTFQRSSVCVMIHQSIIFDEISKVSKFLKLRPVAFRPRYQFSTSVEHIAKMK